MDHFEARFMIESERRRTEMAVATQYGLLKEAQRAGMKIPSLLSLKVRIGPLAVALTHGLDWLGHLFTVWSCCLQSRYASVPLGASLESQTSPCSS